MAAQYLKQLYLSQSSQITRTMDFTMGKLVKYFVLLCTFLSYPLKGQGAPYEKYADEIIHSFVRDVRKEYGLVCAMTGGRMSRDVETITVHFHGYQKITVEEARVLIVKLRGVLVDRVNAHKEIRPFLREYPFTWRGADVSISFHEENGSYRIDGGVAFVCPARGDKISYDAAELQMRKLPDFQDLDGSVEIGKTVEEEVFVPLLTETYEEALEIVKLSQSNGNLVHGKTR
jgi:hypothetical protein